jgi:hypothetical protein
MEYEKPLIHHLPNYGAGNGFKLSLDEKYLTLRFVGKFKSQMIMTYVLNGRVEKR